LLRIKVMAMMAHFWHLNELTVPTLSLRRSTCLYSSQRLDAHHGASAYGTGKKLNRSLQHRL
jgi:hypothetical protein